MQIRGVRRFSPQEINLEVEKGARFVRFQTCISMVLVTQKEETDIQFINAGESVLIKSLPYSLVSLLFGWWGIPWGPIYTVVALWSNSAGGRDVTSEVVAAMNRGVPYAEPIARQRNRRWRPPL